MEALAVDTEFIILESIYDGLPGEGPLRQRDLARVAGASLGMTNSILKRLAQRGWITVKRVNRRNIRYGITAEGINEIVRRGYGYFKRTIRHVVRYKESLEELILRARRQNITAVLLIGVSELDFILEHLCHRYGLSFLGVAELDTVREALDEKTLAVFAETIPEEGRAGETRGSCYYLSRLMVKKAAEGVW
jgi:DNA-binding MarR family transcriptional regulator